MNVQKYHRPSYGGVPGVQVTQADVDAASRRPDNLRYIASSGTSPNGAPRDWPLGDKYSEDRSRRVVNTSSFPMRAISFAHTPGPKGCLMDCTRALNPSWRNERLKTVANALGEIVLGNECDSTIMLGNQIGFCSFRAFLYPHVILNTAFPQVCD